MPKKPILVMLQNAYDKETLKEKPYSVAWWKEFTSSRTGERLEEMLHPLRLDELHFCNTTPKVGTGSCSKLPPCLTHVRRVLRRVKPRLILACGGQAERVCCDEWEGDLIVTPHPCYRVLTSKLLAEASRMIQWRLWWYTEPGMVQASVPSMASPLVRIAFRQQRGNFLVESLIDDDAAAL